MSTNQVTWFKTKKKSYNVWGMQTPVEIPCYNYLEDSIYITSAQKPWILSGTRGEEWTVDAQKIASTYTPVNGTFKAGWNLLHTRADSYFVWALPTKHKIMQVQTSWGEVLTANRAGVKHGPMGDFIIASDANGAPNLNDRWVVNGEVFADTYDLRGAKFTLPQSIKNGTITDPLKPAENPIALYGIGNAGTLKAMRRVTKAECNYLIPNMIAIEYVGTAPQLRLIYGVSPATRLEMLILTDTSTNATTKLVRKPLQSKDWHIQFNKLALPEEEIAKTMVQMMVNH